MACDGGYVWLGLGLGRPEGPHALGHTLRVPTAPSRLLRVFFFILTRLCGLHS